MNNKFSIITCNYTGPDMYDSIMCGRLNRDELFTYGLASIAQTGENIINFSHDYNIGFVNEFLKSENITNVTTINYPLQSSPWHEESMRIKHLNNFYYTDVSWKNRVIEIMWNKTQWCLDVMSGKYNNNIPYEDTDFLMWLDVGISNGGCTDRRFNKFELLKGDPKHFKENGEMKLYESYRHDHIFNNLFLDRFKKYCDGKIGMVASNHAQHGDVIGLSNLPVIHKHPIGGIWGGYVRELKVFCNRFTELGKEIMSKDKLVKEEVIYSIILHEMPELFKDPWTFQTWYHLGWQCYDKNLVSFCDFYDKVLGCSTN